MRASLIPSLVILLICGTVAPPAAAEFTGDTYSFQSQLGALIDGLFQCFSVHATGGDDNTVLFDGLSELLDPYVNGTMPFVFEFEDPDEGTADIFSMANDDLFPEGFEDPKTGTPLDAACVEIGIDDTLDSSEPLEVTSALIEFRSDGSPIFPPIDISSAFSNPWDGRLSVVFPGLTGMDIDEVSLRLTTQPDQGDIFADGFESGDASSWR